MPPIIYYDGANQHSVSAGPKHRVVLNPGQNKVDDEVWNKITEAAEKEAANENNKTRGGVTYLLENGKIKVLESAVTGNQLEIGALNQKDALELIDIETSTENLVTFLKQEKGGKARPKLIAALESKILNIEEAEAAEAERDGSSDD